MSFMSAFWTAFRIETSKISSSSLPSRAGQAGMGQAQRPDCIVQALKDSLDERFSASQQQELQEFFKQNAHQQGVIQDRALKEGLVLEHALKTRR